MRIGAVKQHLQKLHKTGIDIIESTILSLFDKKYPLFIDQQELINQGKPYYDDKYQLWCYEFE